MAVEGSVLCNELNLNACIQCGKCTGGCPVSIRSELNPRKLVYEALLNTKFVSIERDEIWECTACATCAERCPKQIKPYEVVFALRSDIIESGRVKPMVRDALESTFLHGNPWGRVREKRIDWIEDKRIRILNQKNKTDLLYYVCCTVAYDTRVQTLAKNMIQILMKANIDFAILGNEENCCANEMNEMGEKGLFEMVQENNVQLFAKYQFPLMVTTSPHCFHAFTNTYTKQTFNVVHYTQLISQYIKSGQLRLNGQLSKKVTYHDPCFLGKRNKIFDEPRYILQNINGLEYLEMDRSRERSVCCEGGGGRMWMESRSSTDRLAEIRVDDAVNMGAEVIATACPFCLLTLEDAVKTTGNEEKIKICDILELLVRVL